MKKLFHTGSLIEIEGASLLRINGPYALVALGPDSAKIRTEHYMIEVIAEELKVDAMSEEVALLTFESIREMTMVENKEPLHGS